MTALTYQPDEERPPLRHGVTLREILISLFKDARVIGTVFVLVAVAGIAASFLAVPRYQAQASLLVKMGREYLMRPHLTSEAVPAISSERIVASEVDILRAPALVLAAVTALGPTRLYPDLADLAEQTAGRPWLRAVLEDTGWIAELEATGWGEELHAWFAPVPSKVSVAEAAAERFTKALEVIPGRESNTIFVTFLHPDRALAEQALETLITTYLERRRDIFSNLRADFVRGEAAKVRDRLEALDRRIETFKIENGIIEFARQREALLAQQATLMTARVEAENHRAEATQRSVGLREMLDRIDPTIKLYAEAQTSRATDDTRSLLIDLQMRERAMATRFADTSLALREIRQQITEAERALRADPAGDNEVVRTGTNPLFEQVRFDLIRAEADRQANEARLTEIDNQLASLAETLRSFDAKGIELAQLERERDVTAESYRVFARQGDEATVLDEVERQNRTNVALVQAPLAPARPLDIQPLVILVTLFAALVAAVATALVMELRRSGFLTPEKLERTLGVPVLAAIPEMGSR